jgi:1-acyl-sn-glycerol-3-phosphate acyltransferase
MFKRGYFFLAYWLSWLLFGAAALALSLACALLGLWPGRARGGRAVRAAIHGLFLIWIAWLRALGLFVFRWEGSPLDSLPRPAVVVANHPSLVDATFLLAHLPDAVCVLKPSLLRNPLFGPAARIAGYGTRDAGVDLIRGLAQTVAAGRTLLIFPEGTRTDPGAACNPLKPGFALIARRARVPIQVLVVRTGRDLLPRGRPWWRMPRIPIHYAIAVGPQVDASSDRSIDDIVAEVHGRFCAGIAGAS